MLVHNSAFAYSIKILSHTPPPFFTSVPGVSGIIWSCASAHEGKKRSTYYHDLIKHVRPSNPLTVGPDIVGDCESDGKVSRFSHTPTQARFISSGEG